LFLDHAARLHQITGENQLHGLARPQGARTKYEIERARRRRKMPADPARRLAATAGQPSLVVFDIPLPARLGMPYQVQRMHGGSPNPGSETKDRGEPGERHLRAIGSACRPPPWTITE